MGVIELFQSLAADFYDTGIQKLKSLYDKCPNSRGKYLKNSSTLAVSGPINFSTKLGFVSVNGPRETYFVDALRTNIKNKSNISF